MGCKMRGAGVARKQSDGQNKNHQPDQTESAFALGWRSDLKFNSLTPSLLENRDNNDGTSVVISEGGRRLLRRFDFDQIKLTPPARWDKHWRLVVFDIPEHRRAARVALREKLKELGFRELQKSVLIHPFPCQNEIDFLVEFFEIRPHVRLIEASAITNEAEWLLKFNLRK